MNRYFIEEVKCDWAGGCGPCCGVSVVTTSVKFKNEDGSVQWLTLNEVDGMLSFYVSEEELFDKFLSYDELDEEDEEYDEIYSLINDEYLTEFEGIELSCEEDSEYYEEMFEELEDNFAVLLLKYAICVNSCATSKLEGLIEAATGKYIDEVEYDPEDACAEEPLEFLTQGYNFKDFDVDGVIKTVAVMLINLNVDCTGEDSYLYATIIKTGDQYEYLLMDRNMIDSDDYDADSNVIEKYSDLNDANPSKYFSAFVELIGCMCW